MPERVVDRQPKPLGVDRARARTGVASRPSEASTAVTSARSARRPRSRPSGNRASRTAPRIKGGERGADRREVGRDRADRGDRPGLAVEQDRERPQVGRRRHRQARQETDPPDRRGGPPDDEDGADGQERRPEQEGPDGLLPRDRTRHEHGGRPQGQPQGAHPEDPEQDDPAGLRHGHGTDVRERRSRNVTRPAAGSSRPSRAEPDGGPGGPNGLARGRREHARSVPRSTLDRRCSANASAVRWPSYRARSNRWSTARCTRRRRGWNRANAIRVDAATAIVFSFVNGASTACRTTMPTDEHPGQERRHDRPAEGAADEPIDLVQAVAQDRDPDHDRQGEHRDDGQATQRAGQLRVDVGEQDAGGSRIAASATSAASHLTCWRCDAATAAIPLRHGDHRATEPDEDRDEEELLEGWCRRYEDVADRDSAAGPRRRTAGPRPSRRPCRRSRSTRPNGTGAMAAGRPGTGAARR